jgi:hypothetical protein
MRNDERQVQMRREFRGEMNVHVPEARDRELPRAIDHEPGTAGAHSRGQPSDPAVLDLYRTSRTNGGGLCVDDGDVLDDKELGSGWRFRKPLRPEDSRSEPERRQDKQDGEQNECPLQ